ncbi:MAG TPA: sialidase family protein [Bryobacteraceae bacterium]|nr:sialidase family protein [Bryobacteraceae bacterium]
MSAQRSLTKPLWCGLLLVTFAIAQGQVSDATLAPAPGRRIVTLIEHPGSFHTPSIAVNPANPREVVVGFQSKVSAAYSTDGGEHWAVAPGTAPENYRSTGDTSITYDRQGHAILCFIAFDGAGPFKYWGHNPKRNGILVRRSLDGGKTWEPRTIPVIEHAEAPGIPFEDKPYIVADNQPKSPYFGNLYVGWSQDGIEDALIVLSRSTDGGLTWSTPVRISDQAGLPRDDNGTVEGFAGVVAPDGALHVVWSDNASHVAYTVSRDGGKTFSRNRSIADTAPSHFVVLGAEEANGYPQIAIAPDAKLYVAWSDYRNGDVDVFCISSADGGRTWSRAVRVNSDPLHDSSDQFFQWMAVDPVSGTVNVLFYDRRRDPANKSAEVVLARSTDGGRTFRNYLLSDHAFDPKGGMIGEYTGLTAFGDRVYGSWTEIVPPAGGSDHLAAVIRVGMADFR